MTTRRARSNGAGAMVLLPLLAIPFLGCSRDASSGKGASSRPTTTARIVSTGEELDEWVGADGLRKVQHWSAISWDYVSEPRLSLADAPADLGTHAALRFVIDHEAPTDRTLVLTVESDDPDTAERDGWSWPVGLDFKGPLRCVVHRDEMTPVGRPIGWGAVTGLSITTRGPGGSDGTDEEGGKSGRLGVAMLCLVDVAKVGIVLTDDQLFAALDLDHQGLEEVRGAVREADTARAVAALAAAIRNRTDVPWDFVFEPDGVDEGDEGGEGDDEEGDVRLELDENALDRADRVARGAIRLLDITHEFPDGEIDWRYNPTRYRAELAYTRQWESRLHDMGFWRALTRGYVATRDERYAEAWVRQFESWTRGNPFEDEPVERLQSRAWHAMRAANRMRRSWPDAFHAFLPSPAVTDRVIVDFVKSCLEHGRHLRRNHDRGTGEHQNTEMQALFTVGALFPELTEAREWRGHALQTLAAASEALFYADGVAKVLSPSYHARAIRTLRRAHEKAVMFGREDELPPRFLDPLEAAADAVIRLMAPDRSLPTINDCTETDVPSELAAVTEIFPHRPEFRWIATGGAEGSPPERTSHSFPWAGYHVMRSGWEEDANYLCFDNGPLGLSHCHQDQLNVLVWAYGRGVLFDDGGGEYEESVWRQYATDTFSHNLVLVDGNGQRRQSDKKKFEVSKQPIDSRWRSGPSFDFAAGEFDGKWGTSPRKYDKVVGEKLARHTRRVLFVKPDLFVVADTIEPRDDGTHAVEARWQLASTETSRAPTGAVSTVDDGVPNLVVVPLFADGLRVTAASAQTEPELLGWRVRKYEAVQREPATTVVHARSGEGPQTFLTLLVPLRAGEADPVRTVRPLDAESAEVTLADGRTWRVKASADPSGAVEFVERLADGSEGRTVAAGD